MHVRPYPFARWSRLGRDEAGTLNALASVSLASLAVGAPAELAEKLLGASIEITSGLSTAAAVAPSLMDRSQARRVLGEALAGVVLETQLGGRALRAVVELPVELAASIVDRVLGGDGSVVHPVGAPLDELSMGALGYLAARLCSSTQDVSDARSDVHAHVRAHALCTTAHEAVNALSVPEPMMGEPPMHGPAARLVMWPIDIAIGALRGRVRVWLPLLPSEGMHTARIPRRSFDVPATLLDLPLQLCAHAACVVLRYRELSALRPGDVVLPERTALSVGPLGWYGAIDLHVLGNRNASLPCHAQGNELTLGSRVVRQRGLVQKQQVQKQQVQKQQQEQPMAQGEKVEAQPPEARGSGEDVGEALLRDAPIELCVELARFTIPLEQLLSLRAGEVWSTGRPIGEHVTLSAAGKAVARGELVDVDGEIGVRVLERFA